MKLPPDIDRLAWSVAESNDPRLRREFAARHPEYAEEMERRATLVDDRGHIPAHAASGIALPVRRGAVPTWAVVLAGVSVGAIAIAALLPRPGVVVHSEIDTAVRTMRVPPESGGISAEQSTTNAKPQDIPPVSSASPDLAPAAPKTTSLRLEGTALHDALALIAAAGNLTIRVDPEIPDPEVRQNLTNLTPRQMIDQLGGEYGFRIVEEAPGSLVLVPLGEPGNAPDHAANEDGGEVESPAPPPSRGPDTSDFPLYGGGNP